jgi:hypothetical protein
MTHAGERGSLWRIVLPPLLAAKVLWLAVALIVLRLDHPDTAIWPGLHDSLLQWDAISYLQIAAHGYPANPGDARAYLDAFLPGFPLLLRGAQIAVPDGVLAAWLVTFVTEAVALWYVARLVIGERDRAAATFAVWLLALAPTALFLTAPFTESPFIAAAAAALYHARANHPRAAALTAMLASAIRITGLALLPALALDSLMRNRWRPRSSLTWLAIIPLPVLLYCAYMQVHTGDALALVRANASPSFGHSIAWPWQGFAATWNTLTTAGDGETRSIFAREIAFGLLGLVACAGMWASTRIPRSLAVYCSIAWLLTAALTFWRSEPRYVLALFPAVLLASDLTARIQRARYAAVAASAVLMCAGVWVFAEGRWLG